MNNLCIAGGRYSFSIDNFMHPLCQEVHLSLVIIKYESKFVIKLTTQSKVDESAISKNVTSDYSNLFFFKFISAEFLHKLEIYWQQLQYIL